MSYTGVSETYLKNQQPFVSILGGMALPKAHILRAVKRKGQIPLPKRTLCKGKNSCRLEHVKLVSILCLPERFTEPEMGHISVILL